MRDITDRQRAVLEAIHNMNELSGFPPTMRELAAEVGIKSTNGINEYLQALERKGMVARKERVSRTIRLTDTGRSEIGADESDVDRLRREVTRLRYEYNEQEGIAVSMERERDLAEAESAALQAALDTRDESLVESAAKIEKLQRAYDGAAQKADAHRVHRDAAQAKLCRPKNLGTPLTLAQAFHEAYERLAPEYAYETREASAVPWNEVPENQRKLMIATCRVILENDDG
jgi:SOS-response transcriptional repressor LexA